MSTARLFNRAKDRHWEPAQMSLRESDTLRIAQGMSDWEPIADVLARFWRRHQCGRCNGFGWCPHRNRKVDLELILRMRDRR